MGRVANIYDVANAPKTPRSAKGCVKLCVKDDSGAITVSEAFLFIPFIVDCHLGPALVCRALASATARIIGLHMDKP